MLTDLRRAIKQVIWKAERDYLIRECLLIKAAVDLYEKRYGMSCLTNRVSAPIKPTTLEFCQMNSIVFSYLFVKREVESFTDLAKAHGKIDSHSLPIISAF